MRFGCFCDAKGRGSKKTLLALERARSDIARRRQRWRSWQAKLDARRLVFIDETWIKTNMAPLRGWGPKGERLRSFTPHGHWRTLTFLGALRCDRLTAPCLFDGPINGECFRAYVQQVLVPQLQPGDIVIMDMCGRPRWCKKNLSKSNGAWSGADMCPAFCCGCTCRGPVWEFAERVQFNLACSRRVSMIWFSRSRLVDRCAILSD
jgi:DDE superfamily endonuclease